MTGSYERFSSSHVERTGSSKDLHDSYALRYEVYCLEEQFLSAENYPDGIQYDDYDSLSQHFIVRENKMDKIAGCARLIKYSKELGFPTADHFSELFSKLSGLPLENMYEVSRFCVSPYFRQRMVPKDGLYGVESYLEENKRQQPGGQPEQRKYPIILLLMIKEMYRFTLSIGGRYWIASMEPGLIRYFSACGMKWEHLADNYIDFYGRVMPCLIDIKKAIVQMSEKRPDIYEFLIYEENTL
jgi:N-acyl amino acid synthase of PEP-CTERM/exosortase system